MRLKIINLDFVNGYANWIPKQGSALESLLQLWLRDLILPKRVGYVVAAENLYIRFGFRHP